MPPAEPLNGTPDQRLDREAVSLPSDGLPVVAPPTLTGQPRGWLRDAWPSLAVLLASAAVAALTAIKAGSALRAVSVLVYIAVIPGLACVRLIRIPDRGMELLFGVVASLALGILAAQTMIYLHRWSPLYGLWALIVIASLAALTELLRLRWGPGRQPAGRRHDA